MARAVCPGSFDPVTRGHLDVIGRAAAQFETLVVAIGVNPNKRGWFEPEQRMDLVRAACSGWRNVEVSVFEGLLVDFCVENAVDCIVKGVRGAADLEHEMPMAQMNRHLTGVETLFLAADPQWSYVSSSLVREVATLGGDVSAFLTPEVAEATQARLGAGN